MSKMTCKIWLDMTSHETLVWNLYFFLMCFFQGYLTENGIVNLSRVQLMMSDLGEMEDDIFVKRRETELNFRRRNKDKKARMARVCIKWDCVWVGGVCLWGCVCVCWWVYVFVGRWMGRWGRGRSAFDVRPGRDVGWYTLGKNNSSTVFKTSRVQISNNCE